jgi:hypothetical protein
MSSILDRVLYHFNDLEPFTIRDACEGVQIFGGIGSGKTSGSGESLAKAFLKSGMGGLVLAAKKDVLDDWQRYAKETGRSHQILVFDISGNYVFPFLQYEIDRKGEGAGFTENLVRLFMTVYEAVDQSVNDAHDPYWPRAMQQLLRNTIDLCLIARGTVSVPLIQNVILSAPNSNEEACSDKWLLGENLCATLLREAEARYKAKELDYWTTHDLSSTSKFWFNEYPSLGEKQRASIQSMLTSMMDIFLRHPFRMLFSETPEDERKIAYPELSHHGAIIILNLPIKEFANAGRAAQAVYKYIWQQAVERRKVDKDTKPVFLWIDEAQNFVTEYDMLFQSTARSTMVCTVYITQNLPNYYAQIGGGEKGKNKVDSLVGNLQTKIWHANSDPVTNEHAAKVIGQSWQPHQQSSDNFGRNSFNINATRTESFDYDVPPQLFTTLRKGGPANHNVVEAVVFQNGRIWQNNKTYLLAQFKQRFQ